MENMQYAEELVKEFLIFRGFTSTLQAFERELGTDIGKGFHVDKILELIFSVYIPQFRAEDLIEVLSFFKKCFSSASELVLISTLSKLEGSILRYYVVHALQSGRKNKVTEFFGMYGNDLLQRDKDWTSWFAILYLKNPSMDPQFRIYFSQEWFNALHLSVRNFLSEMFNGTRIPALLKISSEKNTVNRLKKDIRQLNVRLSELQALLEEKEAQLFRSRSNASSVLEVRMGQTNGTMSSVTGIPSTGVHEVSVLPSRVSHETCAPASEADSAKDWVVAGPAEVSSELIPSKFAQGSSSKLDRRLGESGTSDTLEMFRDDFYIDTGREMDGEEEFLEVKVDFQETFLGHTSPISRCRFSASGNNIASASVDGTVRIWTYDPSTPASRNATIYCGAVKVGCYCGRLPDMSRFSDVNSNALSPPNPSWFTPKRLLGIFCVINLLNYVDRGAIASNGVNGSRGTCTESGTCTSGTGIQGDFNLNNFEDGVLSSAFMVGLLVASPIFASLAKSVNPFRLIGVGLSVWTFATAGCGIAFDFWSITICRMLVGVGEASFISLAAPFIDDNAPVDQKTAWLGIFYMCIPAGVALGYVYGGLVGGYSNWRFAFFGEAILMLPFAVLGFVMKPLQLKGFSPAESKKALTAVSEVKDDSTGKGGMLSMKEEFVDQTSKGPSKPKCGFINLDQLSRFLKDVKVLLLEQVYVVNVLGYMAYNFVIGAYSYWGPKAGYNIYHMSDADLVFGGITIVSGILGTVAGGFVLDKMTNTIPNAFKLLSAATFLGAGFCFTAFCFKNLYAFLALFAIGELLVFATQGPVNYVSLHCVKPSMRPLSMAMSTVSIHIFGDVPSSPLVGVLQDYVNNWRETALILTSVLFLAAGIWFIGIFVQSVDRFNEDSDHPVIIIDTSSTMPLLEESIAERTEL